jgi:hypothetical protein
LFFVVKQKNMLLGANFSSQWSFAGLHKFETLSPAGS